MILTDILKTNAQKFAKKKALTMRLGYRTVSLTYKEVHELAQKFAYLLEQKGIGKNDKVILVAPNSPYWVVVFWGCLLRGAVLVPLNTQSTPEMIEKIQQQTEAKLTLNTRDLYLLKEDLREVQPPTMEVEPPYIEENDLVEILYTSGTTGDPKGVMLTHKNLFSNLEAVAQLIPSNKLSARDRFLSILPLSHIFEQMAGFLLPSKVGAEIVYAHSPTVIADLIKAHRITKMAAVPEFLKLVMSKIEKRGWAGVALLNRLGIGPLSSLDTVVSGGAPLEAGLEGKWLKLGVNLLQGYGLTETSPVVTTNTFANHRLSSVGKVIPGIELKIAEDGEILVKGPSVFRGYFKNEEKTRAAFTDDNWFKTDDGGKVDKDGFLYVRGRKKYMIKGPGAQNIFPEDIEFELNKIPGVKDSCVVGRTKLSGLLEIHAVILPADPNLPKFHFNSVVGEANKHLASYQQISGWSIWPEDDFPRSATRKVKKEEVLKWLKSRVEKTGEPLNIHSTNLERLVASMVGAGAVQVNDKTNLVRDLGLDSLMRVELVARIEEIFGVVIEETAITPETAIADLEKLIREAQPQRQKLKFKHWPRWSWVDALRCLIWWLIILPLARLFIKLKVENKEALRDLPTLAIFMPNHISYLDSLVVAMALPYRFRKRLAFAAAVDVLYKKYWWFAPVAEFILNSFPFPRREGENIKFGLEYMGRLLDDNWSLVIYPEGQMSETGELLPLKKGAGLVGVEMGCSVVPVKITGSNQVVPYGKIMPRRRGLVTVKFGQPMKSSLRDSYITTTQKIEEALRKDF